jgi:hypothetical protein
MKARGSDTGRLQPFKLRHSTIVAFPLFAPELFLSPSVVCHLLLFPATQHTYESYDNSCMCT